jgi:hypothetical protein
MGVHHCFLVLPLLGAFSGCARPSCDTAVKTVHDAIDVANESPKDMAKQQAADDAWKHVVMSCSRPSLPRDLQMELAPKLRVIDLRLHPLRPRQAESPWEACFNQCSGDKVNCERETCMAPGTSSNCEDVCVSQWDACTRSCGPRP